MELTRRVQVVQHRLADVTVAADLQHRRHLVRVPDGHDQVGITARAINLQDHSAWQQPQNASALQPSRRAIRSLSVGTYKGAMYIALTAYVQAHLTAAAHVAARTQ